MKEILDSQESKPIVDENVVMSYQLGWITIGGFSLTILALVWLTLFPEEGNNMNTLWFNISIVLSYISACIWIGNTNEVLTKGHIDGKHNFQKLYLFLGVPAIIFSILIGLMFFLDQPDFRSSPEERTFITVGGAAGASFLLYYLNSRGILKKRKKNKSF